MKAILLFTILLLTTPCFSQKLVTITKTIKVEEKYNIKQASFRQSIPIDVKDKQSIIKLNIDPKADTLYSESGEMYAKWDISDFRVGDSIKINFLMAIHPYDFHSSQNKTNNSQRSIDLDAYLKNDNNLNLNSKKIESKAKKLSEGSDLKTVKNVFNFVTNHMQYEPMKGHSKGAKKSLENGIGDCTEYSELMVALCRASKIPARVISGYALIDNKKVEYHSWVEVFLAEYGWTPFDPTFADNESTNTTFDKMKNLYVYLSNSAQHLHDYREFEYTSNHYKLDFGIEAKWKDITLVKHFELLKLYNKDNHLKTKMLLDTLLQCAPNNKQYITFQAVTQARLGNFDKAQSLLQTAWSSAANNLEKSSVLYAFTNYFALKGDLDSAISYLEKAVELGFSNIIHVINDRDLKSLIEMPRFKEIVESMEK